MPTFDFPIGQQAMMDEQVRERSITDPEYAAEISAAARTPQQMMQDLGHLVSARRQGQRELPLGLCEQADYLVGMLNLYPAGFFIDRSPTRSTEVVCVPFGKHGEKQWTDRFFAEKVELDTGILALRAQT